MLTKVDWCMIEVYICWSVVKAGVFSAFSKKKIGRKEEKRNFSGWKKTSIEGRSHYPWP